MMAIHIQIGCGQNCEDLMYRLVKNGEPQGLRSMDVPGKISESVNYTEYDSLAVEIHSKSSTKFCCRTTIVLSSTDYSITIPDVSSLFPENSKDAKVALPQ